MQPTLINCPTFQGNHRGERLMRAGGGEGSDWDGVEEIDQISDWSRTKSLDNCHPRQAEFGNDPNWARRPSQSTTFQCSTIRRRCSHDPT
jgi:hypothetical protein